MEPAEPAEPLELDEPAEPLELDGTSRTIGTI